MTLQSLQHRYEMRTGHRSSIVDSITWEPQLPRTTFRRSSWEQAVIADVSWNGAIVQAHANPAIKPGSRVSIGLGNARGLVAVRRITDAAATGMAEYSVQFLWLDPQLQTFFDDAASTDTPIDFG